MIRVRRPRKPRDFDKRCRQRGRAWLKNHPGYNRPEDYWSEFRPQLRAAFRGLCGFCAMKVMSAQVDHFIPISVLKKTGRDELAYEWSNFRYVVAELNQRKYNRTVLDPYEVKDDWFKILLPSLQLVLTENVPEQKRLLAKNTLQWMGLDHGEDVIEYRKTWYQLYYEGKLTLEGLREVAPLIAAAVDGYLAAGKAIPSLSLPRSPQLS
ncbi:MAG: hypothetical protein ACRC8S_10675 [Fimbriiglobus sp.]